MSKVKHDRWKVIFDVALLLLIGLIPLLWFQGNLLINGADLEFPVTPVDNFYRRRYLWDDRLYTGWDQSQEAPHLFPYYPLLAFLEILGFSLVEIEMIWFVIIFTLPALSMYYLVSYLSEPKIRRIAALTSALFYTLNLHVIVFWHDGNQTILLAYGMWPILLALWMKGLRKESLRDQLKTATLIGLASLLMAPSSSSPPTIIVTTIILALYFIHYLFTTMGTQWIRAIIDRSFRYERGRLIRAFRFVGIVFGIYLLVNSWWSLPIINITQQTGLVPASAVLHFSREASFMEFVRLLGFWGWYEGYLDMPYFTFAENYATDPLLVLTTLILPLIAFLGLILAPKEDRDVPFFALIAVVGLFMAKSFHEPFGELYSWIFYNLPGAWAFRNPYKRFEGLAALGYAFLGGILVARSYDRIRTSAKGKGLVILGGLGIALIVITATFAPSYPLLTGNAIEERMRVEIPAYYSELESWLEGHGEDYRVFLLPVKQRNLPYMSYYWGYSGTDIISHLISTSQVRDYRPRASANYAEFYEYVFNLTRKREAMSPYIGRIIGLLSAKYILLDKSADWSFYYLDPPEYSSMIARSQDGVVYTETIGEVVIYENKWAVPLVFAAEDTLYIGGGIGSLESIVSAADFQPRVAIFFSELLTPEERNRIATIVDSVNAAEGAPTISSVKIDPTRYEISVHTSSPFILVCTESFNQGWKAYVDGGLEVKDHFPVNGYANGWFIEKTGDYKIVLEYWPQRLLDWGIIVSTLSVLVCVAYLVGSQLTSFWRLRKHPGIRNSN